MKFMERLISSLDKAKNITIQEISIEPSTNGEKITLLTTTGAAAQTVMSQEDEIDRWLKENAPS